MSAKNLSAGDKAGILLETLPWLREYSGSRIVIKYGGNAMISEDLKAAFAQDVSFLHEWGIEPIVVHGGGPQISSMLKTLGIEAPFVRSASHQPGSNESCADGAHRDGAAGTGLPTQ